MSWTDERVELLKKMWLEGQSASQIAKELGGVTRNAVIGKVHRLGLSNRTAGTAEPEKSEPKAKPETTETRPEPKLTVARAEPTSAAPAPLPARTAIIPASQPLPPQPSASEIDPEALARVGEVEKHSKKLSLMELTERTCKWPIGDPATDEFWFCGLPSQFGKPYCEAHVGVAFQPMNTRRNRRR